MRKEISAALMLLEYHLDGFEDDRLIVAAHEYAQAAISPDAEISKESSDLVETLIASGAYAAGLKGFDRANGQYCNPRDLH